jgi:hypothetical protein
MILRRFSKHISDQNWFAVGLDVIVVVVGIFLGMQVTEWNEQRKEDNQETAYLLQMKEDVLASLENGRGFQTNQTNYLDETAALALLVVSKVGHEGSARSFSRRMQAGLFNLNRHHFRRKTWQELINSGRYRTFGDLALREKIDKMISLQNRLVGTNKNLDIYTRDNIDPWLTQYADAWQIAVSTLPSDERARKIAAQMPVIVHSGVLRSLEFRNMLAYRYNFLSFDLNIYMELEVVYHELLQRIDDRLERSSS